MVQIDGRTTAGWLLGQGNRSAPRSKLRVRFLASLFGGGTLVALVGLWFTYSTMTTYLRSEMLDCARLLASTLNLSALGTTSTQDFRRVVEEISLTPEVQQIVIVTRAPPQVLASSTPSLNGVAVADLPPSRFKDEILSALHNPAPLPFAHTRGLDFTYVTALERHDPRDMAAVRAAAARSHTTGDDGPSEPAQHVAPTHPRHLDDHGIILIRLNQAGMQAAAHGILWRIGAALIAVAVIMAAIAYIILQRQVLAPVMHLRRAMDRQISGDRSAFAEIQRHDEIGHLSRAFNAVIRARDRAEAELKTTKGPLTEAIESISEGFVVWDCDDLLVLCNSRFPDMLPDLKDIIRPGLHFSDFVRTCLDHDVFDESDGPIEEFAWTQLKSHRSSLQSFERKLSDGRWVRVNKHLTESNHVVGIWTDITNQKIAEKTIRQLALNDPLTGLGNRNLFHQKLDDGLKLAERADKMVALMILDLDHFKEINDTYGHPVGDRLLIEVARRLETCVRKVDTVVRLGGDEFAIILVNLDSIDAVNEVSQRIVRRLSRPILIEGTALTTGTSIGMSFYPADGADFESLFRKADLALYQAKGAGGGSFQCYDADLHAQVREQRAMEAELREALANEQFLLHYQPQFTIDESRLVGVEALIRWQHPKRGLVPPNAFIPVAETTGLIVPMSEWVLRTACTQSKTWRDQGFPPCRVAVNISARMLAGDILLTAVRAALAESGLEPQYLELEITEAMVIDDIEQSIEKLHQLKQLGVRLAIDDFGTGYSSLSYLKRLPVHRLKIDQTFVRDLSSDPDDAAIAEAIINLGHTMGLMVIAEGVETEDQIAYLKTKGCDELQGYYFSPPVPAADFEAWLTARICHAAE